MKHYISIKAERFQTREKKEGEAKSITCYIIYFNHEYDKYIGQTLTIDNNNLLIPKVDYSLRPLRFKATFSRLLTSPQRLDTLWLKPAAIWGLSETVPENKTCGKTSAHVNKLGARTFRELKRSKGEQLGIRPPGRS